MAAIHWEAMRLWLKAIRFHRRPQPLASETDPATILKS
jgi:DUF1365 family protein